MDLFIYGFTSKSHPSADRDPPDSLTSTSKSADEPATSEKPKDAESENPAKRKKSVQNPSTGRKYDPDYLKYGFTYVESNGKQCPLCVECNDILANSSMVPTKLVRHLNLKHPDKKDKSLEYFQQRKAELKERSKTIRNLNWLLSNHLSLSLTKSQNRKNPSQSPSSYWTRACRKL